MPTRPTILYLHGFASSAQGDKARFFAEKFASEEQVNYFALDFNPTPVDFEHMTITGQINRLRQLILDRQWVRVSLIGSSLGGLIALKYAYRYGEVARLLLLAPALAYRLNKWDEAQIEQWKTEGVMLTEHYAFGKNLPLQYAFHQDGLNYLYPAPPPAPTRIIHGTRDEVVPVTGSRQYAADYPALVELVEVNAGHQLNDQLELIWSHVQEFLL